MLGKIFLFAGLAMLGMMLVAIEISFVKRNP